MFLDLLAFDNSISKKSAAIKGIKNVVAGEADVLSSSKCRNWKWFS